MNMLLISSSFSYSNLLHNCFIERKPVKYKHSSYYLCPVSDTSTLNYVIFSNYYRCRRVMFVLSGVHASVRASYKGIFTFNFIVVVLLFRIVLIPLLCES